mgnify:CR=1 FL=1
MLLYKSRGSVKMKKLISQILKFGFVGAAAFVIDYGLMVLLTEVFNVYSLISAAISFTVSVIFNYVASVKWVFEVDEEKNSKQKQFIVFVILSVIGLIINELIMWIMDSKFGIHYMISKLVATFVVMVWNFITRKIFLEK